MVLRWIAALVAVVAITPAYAAPQSAKDIAYGPDELQKYDVYWDDAFANAPMIVMLHGGAWAIGDKASGRVWEQKVRHWRPKGYVFVSVNTRLLPDAPDLQAADFARAVVSLQRQAKRWGGDPARIVLMGHSAGAHIAALVGGDVPYQRRHGMKPVRGTVVLDSGALNLETLMANDPRQLYVRAFGNDPS